MKFQEITFNSTSNENGSIKHLGDSVGGNSEGDSETISIDLKHVPKRVYAMMMVCTVSTGSFQNVNSCGCRVLQKFSKGRNFGHKEMIRANLDISDPATNKEQAAIMFRFFRSQVRKNKPQTWSVDAVMVPVSAKNADDLWQKA